MIDFLTLQKESEQEIERLKQYLDIDNQELLTSMTIKLAEEHGELAQEILKQKGYARKEKLKKFRKEELASEIADVFFVTALIATINNIDLGTAITKKIQEIKQRDY
jgi:NTP pyrophosphatase (non-canonical NTP hydrolase)